MQYFPNSLLLGNQNAYGPEKIVVYRSEQFLFDMHITGGYKHFSKSIQIK